jgi:hypothetical protein
VVEPEEAGVSVAGVEQLVVCAGLDDTAVLEVHDLVGVSDRQQVGETTRVVRPAIRRRIGARTRRVDSASRLVVGSSASRIGASGSPPGRSQSRWRRPPDRRQPRCPTRVR